MSKYKNAVGILPRKEDWLTDIKVGSPQSFGNHVKASAAFVAFNVSNRGENLINYLLKLNRHKTVIYLFLSFYLQVEDHWV